MTDLNPLTGAANHAVKGEFKNIPLKASDAPQAYGEMKAGDFSGPSDIRLQQLHKAVKQENVAFRRELEQMLKEKWGAGRGCLFKDEDSLVSV